MGELISIVYKPEGETPTGERYLRVPLREAELVAGHGIRGDGKGGPGPRQLNVMGAASVQALGDLGFGVTPGRLGEQLVIAGLDVDALPVGARVRIGESACIEVTEPRTGCGRFESYQGRSREEARGRMGVMARVVEGGEIRVGDPVQALPAVADGAR